MKFFVGNGVIQNPTWLTWSTTPNLEKHKTKAKNTL